MRAYKVASRHYALEIRPDLKLSTWKLTDVHTYPRPFSAWRERGEHRPWPDEVHRWDRIYLRLIRRVFCLNLLPEPRRSGEE